MAIGVYFPVKNMPAAKYAEVLRELTAAGAGAPKGRLYHSAFGSEESLHVFDVFASPEDFEAFGAVLGPILARLGVDPGEPSVEPIHNIIVGS